MEREREKEKYTFINIKNNKQSLKLSINLENSSRIIDEYISTTLTFFNLE